MKAIIFLLLITTTCCYCCDCNNRGACVGNNTICQCRTPWRGDHCEGSYLDDRVFNGFFQLYAIGEVLLQVVAVAYASWQLYIILKYASKKVYFALPTYIMVIAIVGGIIRIVLFAVDPHNVREIFPPSLAYMMFDIPLLMWLLLGFMLFIYWVELQKTISNTPLLFVSKLKPVLIIFAIICTICILSVDLWYQFTANALSAILYNAFFVIFTVVLIISLGYSGYKMINVMNNIFQSTRSESHHIFQRKLARYMIVNECCLIITTIGLLAYSLVDAGSIPAAFLSLQSLFRITEFIMLFMTIRFVSRKKPNKTPSGGSKRTEQETTEPMSTSVYPTTAAV